MITVICCWCTKINTIFRCRGTVMDAGRRFICFIENKSFERERRRPMAPRCSSQKISPTDTVLYTRSFQRVQNLKSMSCCMFQLPTSNLLPIRIISWSDLRTEQRMLFQRLHRSCSSVNRGSEIFNMKWPFLIHVLLATVSNSRCPLEQMHCFLEPLSCAFSTVRISFFRWCWCSVQLYLEIEHCKTQLSSTVLIATCSTRTCNCPVRSTS